MEKKKLGEIEFVAGGSKSGNWETFRDFLEENEICLSVEDMEKFYKLAYILYEVIANTTVYDDGSYDISSIECGGKVYLPKEED